MKKTDIDLDTITSILWEIFQVKQAPITKADLDNHSDLPSYNTCMRKVLRLNKLNSEFAQKAYYENPKRCNCCNSAIPYKKKVNDFCSRSCSAAINNRVTKPRKVSDLSSCLNCGKEFYPTRNSTKKFCSHKCSSDYRLQNNFLDWYCSSKNFQNSVLKNFLTILHGYSCSVCGIFEWNGKDIVLEVEHINGDSQDSSPENVCLICPNCHSQTPTYKGKNAGNGRYYRRLRYKQGKSY